MVVLCHDVVEVILERVPTKSLIRFKHVSKQWKSIIQSKNFQERQLIYRQKSRNQDVLFLTISCDDDGDADHTINIPSSSSLVTIIKLPIKQTFIICSNSCDGLVCLYNSDKSSIVVINPTTRWHRTVPLCNFQQVSPPFTPLFGFGKDKVNGTYKLVLLYDYQNTTICQVFDFSTNVWRYVTPSSPYKIIASKALAYVDGSLHWFTKCQVAKILSFNRRSNSLENYKYSKHPCHVQPE